MPLLCNRAQNPKIGNGGRASRTRLCLVIALVTVSLGGVACENAGSGPADPPTPSDPPMPPPDTTAPSVVTLAGAVQANGTSALLTWADPTDPDFAGLE